MLSNEEAVSCTFYMHWSIDVDFCLCGYTQQREMSCPHLKCITML